MSSGPSLVWGTIEQGLALGLEDMLHVNWLELDPSLPLVPDWPTYRSLERQGILYPGYLLLDGKLIGYTVWFLQPPLHNRLVRWATNDEVYLLPEHRRGRTGVRLIQEPEDHFQAKGCSRIVYVTKPDRRLGSPHHRGSVGDLLSRLGYELGEEVWWKNL